MKRIPIIKNALLCLLVFGACISLLQGLNNAIFRDDGSKDYQWGPSRALLEGTDPYKAHLDPSGSPFILCQAPNYPASGLFFLWPYAMWEWPKAKTLWAISNVCFTAIILSCLFYLLPQQVSVTIKVLLVTLFIMGSPWRHGVSNGQHALFTLAFFLLAVVMQFTAKKYSGIPLAISWFKYTIAFPLSIFFAKSKKGFQTILVAAAIHGILLMFLAVWTGSSPLDLLLGPIKVAQSATGRGYLDVFAIASVLQIQSKLLPGIGAILILVVTFAAVLRDRDTLSSLSILSIASMTVVFHNGYDFIVLVLPLAYALRERALGARARSYLAIVGMIWFADKVFYDASKSLSMLHALETTWFWMRVLLFYGVLAADWAHAFGFERVLGVKWRRYITVPNKTTDSDEN